MAAAPSDETTAWVLVEKKHLLAPVIVRLGMLMLG